MTDIKPTAKHTIWALEAIANYAVYRVQGNAPNVVRSERKAADWPAGLIPDVDDLWSSHEEWDDMEHGDYLLVRTVIAVHAQKHPEDANLGEFLTHLLYHRQNPGDFRVNLPFQSIPIMLGTVSKVAVGNALYAVSKLVKEVAVAKAERDVEEKKQKIA